LARFPVGKLPRSLAASLWEQRRRRSMHILRDAAQGCGARELCKRSRRLEWASDCG
jgi:hypothetical protein